MNIWISFFLVAFASFWFGFAVCAMFRRPLDFSEMLQQAGGTDAKCAIKAWSAGEPTFTLRAQDMFAPFVVKKWAEYAKNQGVNQGKVDGALAIANSMLNWDPEKRRLPD